MPLDSDTAGQLASLERGICRFTARSVAGCAEHPSPTGIRRNRRRHGPAATRRNMGPNEAGRADRESRAGRGSCRSCFVGPRIDGAIPMRGQEPGISLNDSCREQSPASCKALTEIFALVDEWAADRPTNSLLTTLADGPYLPTGQNANLIPEQLAFLMDDYPVLAARVAKRLVAAWRNKLADVQTHTAMAAQPLVGLGGESSQVR